MKYSEKSRDYSIQYAKDKLKRVPLDLTKEKYAEVQAAALACGETVNGFIKKAIDERMARQDMVGGGFSFSGDPEGES